MAVSVVNLCFKCHKLGHLAREYTASWDSPRSAYRGTTFTPGYSYSPYSHGAHTQPGAKQQCCCDSELFEFDLSTGPPCVNVKGKLRRDVELWKCIGTPSFILNVIERGYLSPFVSFPEPAVKNNRSSLSHAEFVEEAIQELVQSGRFVETKVPPRVVNPLSVSVQANGKKRLVLDLRYVDKFLGKMHVKYKDWKTAMSSRGVHICFPST